MQDVRYDDSRWPTATEADARGLREVTQSLRSLGYYHQDLLTFHRDFLRCSQHDYASHPAGWLLVSKGVSADVELDIPPGEQGCDAPPGSDCLRQVLLIGNPVLWWGALLALAASVVIWIGRRDWRHGLAVVGVAATWLPWLLYADRTLFNTYAVMTLPFLVLSITLVVGELLGRSREPSPRRTFGVIVAGSFFVLVLVNFAWFWPIWTGGLLTHAEWLDRIWLRRWI
jgi:dolichyl-phosphate-mannose--protein O-mannosyl transferase